MMNRYGVEVRGIGVSRAVYFEMPGKAVTLANGCQGIRVVLSPSDAIELAAWIIAMTDPKEKQFDEIIRQIEDG